VIVDETCVIDAAVLELPLFMSRVQLEKISLLMQREITISLPGAFSKVSQSIMEMM